MTQPSAPGWQSLLRAATVRLTARPGEKNESVGTGFLIAPNVVATCAHVLAYGEDLPDMLFGRVVASGQELHLATDTAQIWRESNGLDLALLRVLPGPDQVPLQPVVLGGGRPSAGDKGWTFGHPADAYPGGDSAIVIFQGDGRRHPAQGQPLDLPRVSGLPLHPGTSGSPVVSLRTGLVVGMLTTSDLRGSAHLLPAEEILARYAEARSCNDPGAAAWLDTLTDEQLREGGRAYPGPLLRAYLKEVRRAGTPGSLLGTERSTRTVPRLLRRLSAAPSGEASECASEPAEQILLHLKWDTVLIGVPGSGKSHLLRSCATRLAQLWEHGAGSKAVPVLIRATDLLGGRPLPEAIAEAVHRDPLIMGLRARWPVALFEDRPSPGAHWLVLVDGLDEIMDPQLRDEVARMLLRWRAAFDAGVTHRILLSTRPLGPSLAARFARWDRFELELMNEAALLAFAENEFDASGSSAAEATARRFTRTVQRSPSLSEMASTPLWAAMLCQSYLDHAGHLPPSGPYLLYEEYLERLSRGWNAEGPRSPLPQLRSATAHASGRQAADAAEMLFRAFPELVGVLALERLEGSATPLDELLVEASIIERRYPDIGDLREIAREVLRASDLVSSTGDDFTFMHQTLLEFLAAQRIASRPELARRYRAMAFQRRGVVGRRIHQDVNEPFTRFLIQALYQRRDPKTLRVLRDWARQPTGAVWLATFSAEGLSLTSDLTQRAADTAARALLNNEDNPWSSTTPNAPQLANALLQLGDARAPDALAAIAANRKNDDPERLAAAERLTELGDARAFEALAAVATDSHGDSHRRVAAAERLTELGDARGYDVLADCAQDNWVGTPLRLRAATDLANLGDPRGVDLLREIACELSMFDTQALSALADLPDPRAGNHLAALTADPEQRVPFRLAAAEHLIRRADGRALALVTTLATDPALLFETQHRRQAVDLLGRIPGDSASAELARLSTSAAWDPLIDELTRLCGIDPHPDYPIPNRAMVADSYWWGELRLFCAEIVLERGGPHAADALEAFACVSPSDPQRKPDRYQEKAAFRLAEIGDARAGTTLVATGSFEAAEALEQLGDARAVDVYSLVGGFAAGGALMRFGDDRAAEAFFSHGGLNSALALLELGDARGPAVLANLVLREGIQQSIDDERRQRYSREPQEIGPIHFYFPSLLEVQQRDHIERDAREGLAVLTGLQTAEATAALMQVISDMDVPPDLRVKAAAALAQRGEPRGRDCLAEIAADPENPEAARAAAQAALEAL